MSATAKGIILGAVGMLLLLAAIVLIIILTGGYNVAATDRHNPVVGWALTTTMTNSVQGGASELEAPSQITPAMIEAGAGEYKVMCAHCHGGIGEDRAEWAETMRPIPPALAHAASQWSTEEIHWIVDHGIKMTGMPAFGPTHDDATLWNIAAFVKAMPDMTEERYASFARGHGEEGEGGEGGHSHAPGTPEHEDS